MTPSLSDYRKILGRYKAGQHSTEALVTVFGDLLDRLGGECFVNGVPEQDEQFLEVLSGSVPKQRMTYNQWVDIEAGLMAGTRQDHINEKEGGA